MQLRMQRSDRLMVLQNPKPEPRNRTMSDTKSTEVRIRERAYALWEKDGQPEGRPDHYWLQAQAQIEAEEAEPGNESAAPMPKPA